MLLAQLIGSQGLERRIIGQGIGNVGLGAGAVPIGASVKLFSRRGGGRHEWQRWRRWRRDAACQKAKQTENETMGNITHSYLTGQGESEPEASSGFVLPGQFQCAIMGDDVFMGNGKA